MITIRNAVTDKYVTPTGVVISVEHMESLRDFFNFSRDIIS